MTINKIIIVGVYNDKFNSLLELSLPIADIHVYPGLEKHIKKKHADYLPYVERIPEIISKPDYIGKHPTIENSIELNNARLCLT
ncbi:MAG: hypothetical protein M0Z31_03160 [Clostridia bacterium]|nr:hypothetical protein [Clostridia bacterium]